MVAAGVTEDKAEVCARIAWSGAGINLRTGKPAIESLRSAISQVLNMPAYRDAAKRLSAGFARIDTHSLVRTLLEEWCGRSD
jgi:UDP:flavonoid glycosyltransferase YjiC (YdhE family)